MLGWFKGQKGSEGKAKESPKEEGRVESLPKDESAPAQEKIFPTIPQRPPESKARIKTDLLVHDLKVPLAVIEAGISSLLSRRDKYGPITQAQEKVLERVLRNVKVTQTLVSDIMELGRASMGIIHRELVKVSYLVRRAVGEILDLVEADTSEQVLECQDLSRLKQILQPKGILLNIEEQVWDSEVKLDVAKVSQILRNLLSNAMKYKKSMVEVSVAISDQALKIAVKDDGEGIPEEYHKRIFECYFQLDQAEIQCVRGHGLGLAGVMVLVEDLGGCLRLESKAGMGANFEVELPVN